MSKIVTSTQSRSNGHLPYIIVYCFFCTLRPQNETPPEKKEDRTRRTKLDLVIAHQGQRPHQVSLNLASPHFQGLTRFPKEGFLKVRYFFNMVSLAES